MAKHGKKYNAALALVEEDRMYSVQEAADLLKRTSFTKFDGTIEVHMRLGIDPRHADQLVRGTAVLPHGTGKKVRILVFTQGEGERIAREAGADVVGGDEVIAQIEKEGFLDFDIAMATADMMGKVGKLGKILGRRGLMPSPKSGTIVQTPGDLPRAINEVRRGKIEFRNDKTGLIHVGVGKISFDNQQIMENVLAIVDAIQKAKPTGAKGTYVKSITVASTMGPGIPLDIAPTIAASAQHGS